MSLKTNLFVYVTIASLVAILTVSSSGLVSVAEAACKVDYSDACVTTTPFVDAPGEGDGVVSTSTSCPGKGCKAATQPGQTGTTECCVTAAAQTCTVVETYCSGIGACITTALPPVNGTCGEADHGDSPDCTVPL